MDKKVHLSDAEVDVMKILWRNTPPITTSVIMSQLSTEKKWKLSTLTTILSRLSEKGFVNSTKNGKERMYYPEVDEEAYLSYETKKFLKRYHNNSLNSFFNLLYKSEEIDSNDIQLMYKKLDE